MEQTEREIRIKYPHSTWGIHYAWKKESQSRTPQPCFELAPFRYINAIDRRLIVSFFFAPYSSGVQVKSAVQRQAVKRRNVNQALRDWEQRKCAARYLALKVHTHETKFSLRFWPACRPSVRCPGAPNVGAD